MFSIGTWLRNLALAFHFHHEGKMMILEIYKPIVERADKQLLTGLENFSREELKQTYNELLLLQIDYYNQYLKFYAEILNENKHST